MNAHCQRTARDALLYRDGELAPSELASYASHLPDCSSCRAKLDDAKAVASLVREAFDLGSGPIPRDLGARVMADIRRLSPARVVRERKSARAGWESLVLHWRWLAVGGLAIAAAVATVVLPLLSANRDALGPVNEAERAQLRQENEAHIHRLAIDSAGTHPVVLQTAEGRTVIWMISDSQFGADGGSESP